MEQNNNKLQNEIIEWLETKLDGDEQLYEKSILQIFNILYLGGFQVNDTYANKFHIIVDNGKKNRSTTDWFIKNSKIDNR